MRYSKNKTANRVYTYVCSIPKGKVTTYKQIALASNISNPRQVGQILHENPIQGVIPCHRVIRSDGKIADGFAFGGRFAQSDLLKSEGVEVTNNRVDLNKYLSTSVLQ